MLMISNHPPFPAILASVLWARDALLGTVATSVAVICVAVVGFEVLRGHIPVRRLATVIVGCFILFGASDIAAALSALASRGTSDQIDREPPAPVFTVPPRTTLKAAPDPFDPYAGAAVPPGQ